MLVEKNKHAFYLFLNSIYKFISTYALMLFYKILYVIY